MRYTAAQLACMADTALQAKAKGDSRYLQLVMALMLKTGLNVPQIEQNIRALAGAQGAAA